MIKKLLYCLVILCSTSGHYIQAALQKSDVTLINETWVPSGNGKLFCKTMGKGKPLIIIHGGPGLTQDYLLPGLDKLAETNFVIFYDQRGCGRSTGEINDETMNIPSLVDDIDHIRKAFRFDKVSILGHSWGGFLAMHYAIAHPKAVDKLILSNSMPASSEDLSLFVNEVTRLTSPYQEELSKIKNSKQFQDGDPETIERYYRIIFRTYCFIPKKADLLNLRMPPIASVNGAKIYELIRENTFKKTFNLHASLKALNIPTLVIHGDVDAIPPLTAQHTHESIPGSKYILMKNCGHFPYIEEPDMYFNHLKNFLTN